MEKSAIHDVTDTAAWVATYRARESLRPDALFKDPLARILAGQLGERIATQTGNMGADWYVVIRTYIIDRFILSAIAGGVDTVLNLGAGLDTRPYRMQLPKDLLWIEVDYPKIIDQKTKILSKEQPLCRLDRVALDLGRQLERQKLFASVNARASKVLILTEGVLPYLTVAEVASLGKDLSLNSKFKLWIVDYFSPTFMKVMGSGSRKKQMANAPFQFRPRNWEELFSSANWRLKDMQYMAPTGRSLKRDPPYPEALKFVLNRLPEVLQRKLDKMSGFALLEVKS